MKPPELTTYRDVIDLWRSRSGMARLLGVKETVVRAWYATDSIPEWHFERLAEVATRLGFDGITYALLSSMTPGASKKITPQG